MDSLLKPFSQRFFKNILFFRKNPLTKSAFVLFAETFRNCGGQLIDSQVYTSNLARFGARNISRSSFLRLERDFLPQELTGNLQEEFQRLATGVSPPQKKN